MSTKKAIIQAKANITNIEKSGVTTEKRVDWDKLAKIAAVVTTLFGILGACWLLHQELMEIATRQGRLEGNIEILLEDRKDILDSYKATPSEIPPALPKEQSEN
jgi:hypothetical protein